MSFLKTFPYTSGQQAAYPSYYACGPGGETYYVWPTFTQSPDPSSDEKPSPATEASSSRATLDSGGNGSIPIRGIKRRITNNRKERRRTLFLNNAFAELRECIPNVPSDTKLSKIKTLRLATSYIAYLMEVLAEDQRTPSAFKADLVKPIPKKEQGTGSRCSDCDKKGSGRTGWPQHVWALELKNENPTS